MAEAIDFSRTHRIVLLIDLNPLVQSQSLSLNPNPNYITSILTTCKILLSFPSLSSSLFSFKLFFSSLSPLRSASALHGLLLNHHSTSLSFNSPSQTLDSLSQILSSITSTHLTPSPPNASHTASSLVQLVHDYDWESRIENLSGTPHFDPMGVHSNLIILFSPVCRSLECLAEFMCDDVNDESLMSNLDGLSMKFRDCFGVVNDAFDSKDIHFCWIDVDSHEEKVESNKSGDNYALVNEIRRYGWGFSSTNSIVLGSALVPFGLIYPNIGISCKFMESHTLDKRMRGQLNFEISDVSGKPLKCKCCDLELLHLKELTKLRSVDIVSTLEVGNQEGKVVNLDTNLLGNYTDGITNLHVVEVRRYNECEKIDEFSSDHFLVQSAECGTKRKNSLDSSFTDQVLKLLANEKFELLQNHSVSPIWQIFLNFLYREGYWALLCISNGKGDSFFGTLKPFTVHSAFLSVTDNCCVIPNTAGPNLSKIEVVKSHSNIESEKESSASGIHGHLEGGKRRKNRKYSYQDLTWSSFCKEAFERADLDLSEVYFTRDHKNSKKLKFLKCWMKQVKKHRVFPEKIPDGSCRTALDVAKSSQQIETDIDEKLTLSYQESDECLSMQIFSDQSRVQGDTASESCSETSEAFFTNLPKKIQHGLESDGVDLQILAERLVNSSIYWLRQKYKTIGRVDESWVGQVAELMKLLLREPKDLKEQKDNNPSLEELNPNSTSENQVKEYELQIFLRMEILQSEFAESIGGFMKLKLVKQVCCLLEIIQYLVEGGIHGNVSLYDYVEKTIKVRYSESLGDVLDKIYDHMDLLPFGEENEGQALLLNSEDSNQSWRDRQDRFEMAETNKINESASAEDEDSRPFENVNKNHEETSKMEHARKVSEARERRERARRFVSFTSRMPDLQRVWAPKQSSTKKVKPESLTKESKRKKQRRAGYSVVCETPLTDKRTSSSQGGKGQWNNSSGSVSKALFQDHS